jgi:hypothetical protein
LRLREDLLRNRSMVINCLTLGYALTVSSMWEGDFMYAVSRAIVAGAVLLCGAVPATAAISWTDWTEQTNATTVVGTVGGVGVTFTVDKPSAFGLIQFGGDPDFLWDPFPSPDGPTTTDIIALDDGGLKTITFAAPVGDVYLALMSWNVSTTFSQPLEIIAQGCGYWGCGSAILSPDGLTLDPDWGSGLSDVTGLYKFTGPITTLTFTDTNEWYHGIQIGLDVNSTVPAIPEPATWAMVIGGLALAGVSLRRRKTARVSFS